MRVKHHQCKLQQAVTPWIANKSGVMIMGIVEQKHSSHFIERIGRFDP